MRSSCSKDEDRKQVNTQSINNKQWDTPKQNKDGRGKKNDSRKRG